MRNASNPAARASSVAGRPRGHRSEEYEPRAGRDGITPDRVRQRDRVHTRHSMIDQCHGRQPSLRRGTPQHLERRAGTVGCVAVHSPGSDLLRAAHPALSGDRLPRGAADRAARLPRRLGPLKPSAGAKDAVNQNVLPRPGSLSTPISPLIISINCFEMARPSPVPPYRRVVLASAWENGTKSRARTSGDNSDPGIAHFEPDHDRLRRAARQARAEHHFTFAR